MTFALCLKRGWTALMHAVVKSKVEMVALLLRKGADINAKDQVCAE